MKKEYQIKVFNTIYTAVKIGDRIKVKKSEIQDKIKTKSIQS